MKLLLSNVVYGRTYTDLFFNRHLPSLLDESNLPRVKHHIDKYIIFTDEETRPIIKTHPKLRELLSLVDVDVYDFPWYHVTNKFDLRYNVLIQTFRHGAKEALESNSLFSAWTADMILAKDCLPKLIDKMADGFDAVLLHPARCAAEAAAKIFDETEGALYACDLWRVCQFYPHPYLSVANHWRSPCFTRYPFYIHWSTPTGYMTRSFATTPIIMRPQEKMTKVTQVIDIEVPAMFEHPYYADDFDEFGIIQAEPILCYSDAYLPSPPQLERLRSFATERHQHQRENFRRKLFYPNRLMANIDVETMYESDRAVDMILQGLDNKVEVEATKHKVDTFTQTEAGV